MQKSLRWNPEIILLELWLSVNPKFRELGFYTLAKYPVVVFCVTNSFIDLSSIGPYKKSLWLQLLQYSLSVASFSVAV